MLELALEPLGVTIPASAPINSDLPLSPVDYHRDTLFILGQIHAFP